MRRLSHKRLRSNAALWLISSARFILLLADKRTVMLVDILPAEHL